MKPPKDPAEPRGGVRRKRRANAMDHSVGARLKQARLLAGVSQDELGKAIGVSFQAVQKYENGENRLSVGRLAVAAKFLGVPLTFFFQDDPAPQPETAETAGFTGKEIELVRFYRGIGDEEMRDQLLKLTRIIGGYVTKP
jgi:transcriptional regulator with XRE-family HTH domain